MADDIFAGGITFLDDDVFLYVEATDFFAPDVVVQFEGTHQSSGTTPSTVAFSDKLTAQPSTLRDPKNPASIGKKATRIPWKVNVNHNSSFKDTTVILRFTVTGKSASGLGMVAATQEKIVVGAIRVTTDPKLTRIMVHEFARDDGTGNFVFDQTPLDTYLASLEGEQKRNLFKTAIAKPAGRLVVFITIYPRKDLLMHADYCTGGQSNPAVLPNATFSVFHCFDPLKGGVTLVCHTEHFLVNLKNSLGTTKKDGTPRKDPRDTWIEFHKKQDGKTPQQWLAKNNPRPILYKIASDTPQKRDDGLIWSRLFTPKGRDVMTGNTIHGMINTVGCWMLFRNYNWPKDLASQFDVLYRKVRSETPGNPAARAKFRASVDARLAALGYDVVGDATTASSRAKFFKFDANFAFLWFFHEIVGIRYISNQLSWNPDRSVNERTALDCNKTPFVKEFKLSDVFKTPPFNTPEEGTFAYFDPDDRRSEDKKNGVTPPFSSSDAMIGDNALGFRTSQGFIPHGMEFADLSPAQLDAASWADVYLYCEPTVKVSKLTTNNYT